MNIKEDLELYYKAVDLINELTESQDPIFEYVEYKQKLNK